MSSGEIAAEPRPSDGTWTPSFVFRLERTPRRCAIAATFSGPRSSVSWAKTVLSEERVAVEIGTVPR
jgi:hypothetical protein